MIYHDDDDGKMLRAIYCYIIQIMINIRTLQHVGDVELGSHQLAATCFTVESQARCIVAIFENKC